MSKIRKLQHDQGWDDDAMVGLLIDWINQKVKRGKRCYTFLRMIAEEEEISSESDALPDGEGRLPEVAGTRFRCPNCDLTLTLTAVELMEIGEPHCSDCDGKPFSPHVMVMEDDS